MSKHCQSFGDMRPSSRRWNNARVDVPRTATSNASFNNKGGAAVLSAVTESLLLSINMRKSAWLWSYAVWQSPLPNSWANLYQRVDSVLYGRDERKTTYLGEREQED